MVKEGFDQLPVITASGNSGLKYRRTRLCHYYRIKPRFVGISFSTFCNAKELLMHRMPFLKMSVFLLVALFKNYLKLSTRNGKNILKFCYG
jgi:hypothetical protein